MLLLFFLADCVRVCVRTDEIHLFTIRPSFSRKSECLTPASQLWLSSNAHPWLCHMVITNPIYYIFFRSFLFDMVIDWWVQFCQTNFLFIKMKIFSRFYSWTMNICIRRNWMMARNICINKHTVTSLNSHKQQRKSTCGDENDEDGAIVCAKSEFIQVTKAEDEKKETSYCNENSHYSSRRSNCSLTFVKLTIRCSSIQRNEFYCRASKLLTNRTNWIDWRK